MAGDETTPVEAIAHLTDTDREQVLALVARAAESDGTAPLSEHTLLHVRHPSSDRERLLVVRDRPAGHIVAFAHIDVAASGQSASGGLVVDPAHRQRGVGSDLVRELIAASPGGRLDLWAHGDHPGAAALATSMGFRRARVLWQMRRPLTEALPELHLPEGVAIRTFRPGIDDGQWLELNARAFALHPEQGQWAAEDLTIRVREPWFEPEGFFIAERGERMVGFHWTKVHGAEEGHPHEPIGEVYVVGVDPSEQGKGLGPALTIIGLHHLRDRGLDLAMLYVDETNTAAIKVYERLRFAHWHTDVCFRR